MTSSSDLTDDSLSEKKLNKKRKLSNKQKQKKYRDRQKADLHKIYNEKNQVLEEKGENLEIEICQNSVHSLDENVRYETAQNSSFDYSSKKKFNCSDFDKTDSGN